MAEALLALPPHLRKRLADALESGLLAPPFTPAAVRSTLGGVDRQDQVLKALREWEQAGVSGSVAATWVATLERASSSTIPASLVWTGPQAKGLHSRSTRQVFDELVLSAKKSILISSYTYFDGPEAFRVLARKMDECPSLQVTILLNIKRGKFDSTLSSDLVQSFAERLWNDDWPGKQRPAVYYYPGSLTSGQPKGVLHAKAVLRDGETLFVTSANLTEAAMDRNIEIGVLLRDRTIAQTATAHFRALIEQSIVRRLPEL